MKELEAETTEKSGMQETPDDKNSSSSSDESSQSFVMVGEENEIAQYLEDLRYLCTEEVRQLTTEVDLQKRVMWSASCVVATLVLTLLAALAGSLLCSWVPTLNQTEVVLVTLVLGALVMVAVLRRTRLQSNAAALIQAGKQRQARARQIASNACLKSFLNEAGFLEDPECSPSHRQPWRSLDVSPSPLSSSPPSPSPTPSHSSLSASHSSSPRFTISSSEENVPDPDAMTVGAQEDKVNTNENASNAASVLPGSESGAGSGAGAVEASLSHRARTLDACAEDDTSTNHDVSISYVRRNDGGTNDDVGMSKDSCMNIQNITESVNISCNGETDKAAIIHNDGCTGQVSDTRMDGVNDNTGINDEARITDGVSPSVGAGKNENVVRTVRDERTRGESYTHDNMADCDSSIRDEAQIDGTHEAKSSNVSLTENAGNCCGSVGVPRNGATSHGCSSESGSAHHMGDSATLNDAEFGDGACPEEIGHKTNGTAGANTHERAEAGNDTPNARTDVTVCMETVNVGTNNPASAERVARASASKRSKVPAGSSCTVTDTGGSADDQSHDTTAENKSAVVTSTLATATDKAHLDAVSHAAEETHPYPPVAVRDAKVLAAKFNAGDTTAGNRNTNPTAAVVDNKACEDGNRNYPAINVSSTATVEDVTKTSDLTSVQEGRGMVDCIKPASAGTDHKSCAAKPSAGNTPPTSCSASQTNALSPSDGSRMSDGAKSALGPSDGSRMSDGAKSADPEVESKRPNRRFRRGRGAAPAGNRGAAVGGSRH